MTNRETAPNALLSTKRDRAHFRHIATLIASAADALEYAHSMGVVHRDIKPGNLMLDFSPLPASGRGAGGEGAHLWITDFGLAKVFSPAVHGGAPDLTLTGDLIGTLRYMSPEQALARHGLVDHRTDIYSLGATLYEFLTLKPAVAGNDKAEILKSIAWDEPTPLRKLDKSIPAELETITLKCLAKEPGERYGSAGELADDLRRWLGDRAIKAKPPGWREKAGRWVNRHRAMVALSFLFLLTTSIVLAVSAVLLNRARNDEAAQRQTAKANLRVALRALDQVFWPAFEPLLYRGKPPTSSEVEPLQKLLTFYEEFARQIGDDNQLRFETSKARLQTGLTFAAMGNIDRAEAEISRAVEEARALSADRPDLAPFAANHAIALLKFGEFLHDRKSDREAERYFSEAIQIAEKYWTGDPKWLLDWVLAESHARLAGLGIGFQEPLEVDRHFRAAVKYQEMMTARGSGAYNMGRLRAFLSDYANFLTKAGRLDDAEQNVRRAIELTKEVIERERRVAGWSSNLRNHYVVLGRIAQARNRPDDYFDALRNQCAVLQRMMADYPEVADSRYKAARAATLAASLPGVDPNRLDEAERARLRSQSLDWLKADLLNWSKHENRQRMRDTLRRWQLDPDLAGVRDDAALEKLTQVERTAWEKFWSDVADLMKQTEQPKPVDAESSL